MESTSRTQIIYKKTSCCFCNEWFDNNDKFKAHIDECGQILERCPNKCVAYVERKLIAAHLRECSKAGDKSMPRTPTQLTDNDDRFSTMEENVTALRTVLNEEIRQRHRLISDVGELRKQNRNTEEWITKVGDVLSVLKKYMKDETEMRSSEFKNCKEDIDRLAYQYKEVKEWRKELRRLLDHIHEDLEFRNNVTANIETLFSDNQISVTKITALELDVEKFKNRMYEKETQEIERRTTDRSSRVSQDVLRNPSELESKVASLSLEVKQMKNIVCETEDKCDRFERTVRDARKSNAKTRQELRDLEIHLKIQKKMMAIINMEGHLIWRIDQFAFKLQDAKDTDTFIKSPLFCNKQYGYTLRLDVALNGIGTWKDRNILACLTVVPGEWDALLPWPCKLQADIILRDQTIDSTEAKDISKTIIVKKRDVTYEQRHYIFIAHKTLNQNRYLKDDAIFFEVRVHS